MAMRYYIVDAFTDEPFGGYPAGVVLLDGDFPDEQLMQQVAAELRYSETAFVHRQGPAEFTVRYFTPCGEVDLCGHATIATFGLLHREGLVPDGATCLNHTLAGDLKVRIGDQVMMQMAAASHVDLPLDVENLHRIMSAGDNNIEWPDLPVEIISTGLPDIIMPVAGLEALNALRPDMEALTNLSQELNVVGVHAFAMADDGYTAHVRDFAPLYDIPDESATGTANASLTYYLQQFGCLGTEAECAFIQGEAMGRPSVIATRIQADGNIFVGGTAAVVAEGELMV